MKDTLFLIVVVVGLNLVRDFFGKPASMIVAGLMLAFLMGFLLGAGKGDRA